MMDDHWPYDSCEYYVLRTHQGVPDRVQEILRIRVVKLAILLVTSENAQRKNC